MGREQPTIPSGCPNLPSWVCPPCPTAPTTVRSSSSPAPAPAWARPSPPSSPASGAAIAILSRKPEHLEAGQAAIEEVGGRVLTTGCDIREPEQIAAAFDTVEAGLGLPDVLVNNAAANFPVPAEDMSPNAWRTVVDITLNGTFFCAREFGRRHLAAGTPGSIVNVGASYAWTGGPGFAHSAAAKAGVKNMVETLAVEWGPYGIQVNGLVPGLFPHEDMTADIRSNLDRTHEKDGCQPAMRVGRVRELGWAATFLASPYARFISGHTLVVDGANWQRRSLTNPQVVTVRDQMGKDPFDPVTGSLLPGSRGGSGARSPVPTPGGRPAASRARGRRTSSSSSSTTSATPTSAATAPRSRPPTSTRWPSGGCATRTSTRPRCARRPGRRCSPG